MKKHSGRFVLRVAPELHRRLRSRASAEGISLNSLCVRLLETGLSGEPVAANRSAKAVDPGLLGAIAREWSGQLVGIVLFGSAARGDATETSDVDLLVVLENATRIERSLYDRWDRVIESRGRHGEGRVSPQFAALPPSPETVGGLWLEVAREGIVLDDRDGRLAKFLISLRDFVASGAVSRRKVHGHPYWVRERGQS
jgi:hypothetical protein